MNDDDLDAWYDEARDASGDREAVAVEILSRYVLHRPEHAYALYILGDRLRVLGRNDEAREVLGRAVALAPDEQTFRVYASLGKVETDSGSYEKAEEWFHRAAESSGGREVGWVWVFRGCNLARAGRFAEAEKCHRHATTLPIEHFDRDEAWLNLGYVLRAQRRYEEAQSAFREAQGLDAESKANQEAVLSLRGIEDVLERLKAFGTTG